MYETISGKLTKNKEIPISKFYEKKKQNISGFVFSGAKSSWSVLLKYWNLFATLFETFKKLKNYLKRIINIPYRNLESLNTIGRR